MFSFSEICFFIILGSVFSQWNKNVLVKLSIFCSLGTCDVQCNAREQNSYKTNSSELLEEKFEEMVL